MNRTEARDQFLSAAKARSNSPPSMTLEEAKTKFRDRATELDKKMGFEGGEHGAGERGFSFLLTLVSLLKSQAWMLPLLSGIMHLGSKAIHLVLGFLAPDKKSTRRTKRRKT